MTTLAMVELERIEQRVLGALSVVDATAGTRILEIGRASCRERVYLAV